MKCECGYDGKEGWLPSQVYETPAGDSVDGWFCPKCGEMICREDKDCPPDEFGQVWRE